MKFPFLYRPPNGIPPDAAAVSSAKFSDADTWDSITAPFVDEYSNDFVVARPGEYSSVHDTALMPLSNPPNANPAFWVPAPPS